MLATTVFVALQLGAGIVWARAFDIAAGGIPARAFVSSPSPDLVAIKAEEAPDYTCSKTKPCKLGCCGSLFVQTFSDSYGITLIDF